MKQSNMTTLAVIASAIGFTFVTTSAEAVNGYFDCPIGPTEFAINIPNPDPGSGVGEFPTDLDEILTYVQNNNIGSVEELLDHTPDHLRKNYAFVANTRGLGQTSISEPGLIFFGSDGRFMLNMDTSPTSPRYEVVDIAYLNELGDWEFKALDFSSSQPTLSPDGGTNGECRACHGQGDSLSSGPMRPFWGQYLDWPGIFSDNGLNEEKVTLQQEPTLTNIQNGTQNQQRFHAVITPSNFFSVGSFINLPDHQYGNSLTVANNEIGTAVAGSIFKRIKRSARYNELRDEFLTLSYCAPVGETTLDHKTQLIDLIESFGGNSDVTSNNISNGWMDIVRLWGLDPLHEFPLHKLTSEYATTTLADTDWNIVSGNLLEQLIVLVLLDLAEQNQQIDSILLNNQTSYPMTACDYPMNIRYPFDNQKEYLEHKKYANYTLRGSARQLARSSYFDIDYTRVIQSMENVKLPLCTLLTSSIGESSSNGDPVPDTCAQGQAPSSNTTLTAETAICLPAVSNNQQIQMHLYVPSNKVGQEMNIKLAHGTGNGDLLYKYGSRPNLSNYDAISNSSATAETLTIQSAQSGWNYIHVVAATDLTGATLVVSFD